MKTADIAARTRRQEIFGAPKLPALLTLVILWSQFCVNAAPQTAQKTPHAKNVIILSGGRGRQSLNQMEGSLRGHVPWPINFSIIDLENPRFEHDAYRENLAKGLQGAYGEEPDLILACMDPAFRFATAYRDKMFPGVPIVFMSVSSLLADQEKSPGVTGVAVVPGIRDTIDLALRLNPDATAVAVISGESETEQLYLAAVHAELSRHQDHVKEIDIVGPPSGAMLERVAALPAGAIVLFQLFPHDSEQPVVGAYDVLTEAAQHRPTYSIHLSLAVDHGGIGGAYTDATQDAVIAGQIAARVLSGESPDKIPIVHLANFQDRVDWRQLQRWHIPESALPLGTVVLYRQPDLWQRYKWYIIGGISLIIVEAALIIALLWQRTRRRRTEKDLTITYDRLLLAVEAGRSVGWDADFKRGVNRWFGDLQTMFGISSDEYTGAIGDLREHVYPDDYEIFEDAMKSAEQSRKPFAAEFRVQRKDGSVRWISAIGKFYFAPDGRPDRMLGMASDITERKHAEEALNALSGRLIQAQEAERHRIAREIHDDFQQRLALLSIDLDDLSHEADEGSVIPAGRLRELLEQANQLGGDLHSLSHRLHSSALESMGLVAALRGLCTEFRAYHEIEVAFAARDVPGKLPSDVALCLFRVVQEALQNVAKHSQTTKAQVHLERLNETIHLTVSDEGRGFDLAAASLNGGIGLRSMEERLRLVKGKLSIHSDPARGTTVDARVPI